MTTCAECLSVLSTTRLADVPQNSAIASHIETCPNCSRLVTEMQVAERSLALSLDSSIPNMPPSVVAANAITGSELEHRKSVARWVRRALAFATGILVVAFLRSDTGKYMTGADDFQRQSIQIDCLTAASAMDYATPFLKSTHSKIYSSPDRKLITVQGKAQEVSQALAKIELMERMNGCSLPRTKTSEPIPSAGKSGRD